MWHSRVFRIRILILNGLLKDDSFGPMLNLSSCLSREKFYSIRLCVSQRFKPKSFQFLLLRLPASSDVTQSGFGLGIFKKSGFSNLKEF